MRDSAKHDIMWLAADGFRSHPRSISLNACRMTGESALHG
jgi:hypothetical protein